MQSSAYPLILSHAPTHVSLPSICIRWHQVPCRAVRGAQRDEVLRISAILQPIYCPDLGTPISVISTISTTCSTRPLLPRSPFADACSRARTRFKS